MSENGWAGASAPAHLEPVPEGAGYEIRLEGHLDDRWSGWFDGMPISRENDGTTMIRAQVVDQAALHGLLQRVRDIGLPLISVVSTAGRPVEQRSPDVVMPGHPGRP